MKLTGVASTIKNTQLRNEWRMHPRIVHQHQPKLDMKRVRQGDHPIYASATLITAAHTLAFRSTVLMPCSMQLG